MTHRKICTLLFPSLLLVGCITAPAPQTATSVAGYVGDRASLEFNEIVAAVEGSDPKALCNLHVSVGVVINPRKVTVYQPHEVEAIMRRLEPRVSAEVLQIILGRRIVGTLPEIRVEIRDRAQAIIHDAMSGWTEAAAYEVRAFVVSMYVTDGSVVKSRAGGNRWW